MVRPTAGGTKGVWPAARLRALAVAVPLIALAVWSGCSVTKQNYKFMSFFLDGVPNPSLPAGAGAGTAAGGKPAFVVVHRPYAEEKCDACHRTRYRPTRDNSGICLECPGALQTEHERMHGAVIAAACLWCHNPHESAHPALLRNADRKVCGQCHTDEMLRSSRVPEHTDATRTCLECHSGHGSSRPFLLKPGVTETPPAQRPADSAPTGATGGAGG